MKKVKIQFWLLATALFLCTAAVQAQIKYKPSDYKKKPVWIEMMKDTSANYFETIKAFREFYKERALPKEPGEMEGRDNFEKEVGLEAESANGKKSEKERKRELRKQNPNEPNYTFEVKAFKGWLRDTKPWVRGDGTIIGPKERQAIIDKQRNELKAIEKANGKN